MPCAEHMAAPGLSTPSCLFFLEAMLGSQRACCWSLARSSPLCVSEPNQSTFWKVHLSTGDGFHPGRLLRLVVPKW